MHKRSTMLSATFVKSVNRPGRYGDGRGGLGLTLLVKPASRGGYCKSWGQSIRIGGRKTTIGLGAYPVITLAMARERALPHAEVGAALERVKTSGAYAGNLLAFKFLVLTACRPGEVRAARWQEIDREAAVWTVPAERMKAGSDPRARRVACFGSRVAGLRTVAGMPVPGWAMPKQRARFGVPSAAPYRLRRPSPLGGLGPSGSRSLTLAPSGRQCGSTRSGAAHPASTGVLRGPRRPPRVRPRSPPPAWWRTTSPGPS